MALAARGARKDGIGRTFAGSILTAKVEVGEFDSRTFKRWLDKALTRTDDRDLFGLEPG